MKIQFREIRHTVVPAQDGLNEYWAFIDRHGINVRTILIYLIQGETIVHEFKMPFLAPTFIKKRVFKYHRTKFERRVKRLLNWQNWHQ